MLMSSRIRSGGSRWAASSASLPLGTGRTLYPRSLSIPASTWRLAGVSSTTRMLPPPRSGCAGFKGSSRAEQVQQLLILEGFREATQPPGDPGVVGFDIADLREQQVQVGRDDGFAHRVDERLRQIRQGFGRELRRRLRGGGLGVVVGVDVLDPDVRVNLREQVRFPERLAD